MQLVHSHLKQHKNKQTNKRSEPGSKPQCPARLVPAVLIKDPVVTLELLFHLESDTQNHFNVISLHSVGAAEDGV